ncbi:MAG: PhnD/SsuA/transferrin family substrate-binding protein [Deltaproteobacteria bacterium]|nr:PhnD/SsuA/transferrin family substrate-binding protein [Deltaproteobacteria bacterium]
MLRFGLPPSLGIERLVEQTQALRVALQAGLKEDVDVVVTRDYDALRQALLSGAVDCAHAPPFICAQVEPQGVPIIARAVRRGRSSYASAFVVKKPALLKLAPRALRAAWVDPQSVAGHLLPKAHLRAKRHVVEHFFLSEAFYGSYTAALQAVIDGDADVAGVHVIPGDAASLAVALETHLKGAAEILQALEVTAEVPSDGVAARVDVDAVRLREVLMGLPRALLNDVFQADAFEKATPNGYRPLYAIAPA